MYPGELVKRLAVLYFGEFNLCTHCIQLFLMRSYQIVIYLLQDYLYHSFLPPYGMIFNISYAQKLIGIRDKMLGNALLCFSRSTRGTEPRQWTFRGWITPGDVTTTPFTQKLSKGL